MILSHGIGVVIIVHNAGVLIRAGDIVDVEFAMVEVAGVKPKPGGLKNNLGAFCRNELDVFRCQVVGDNLIGDVPIDMVLG